MRAAGGRWRVRSGAGAGSVSGGVSGLGPFGGRWAAESERMHGRSSRVRGTVGAVQRALCVAVCLAVCGCSLKDAWDASEDTSYSDPIQEQVQAKIDQRTEDCAPEERWDRYRADTYQSADVAGCDGVRLELERKRGEAARGLADRGPLRLTDCLAYALTYNDEILAARARLRALGGEELIARSRFLPKLTFDLSATSLLESVGDNVLLGLRNAQTLFEYGKDNPTDVSLRARQRDALFAYEAASATVLSQVRQRFYTLLLRRQQLAIRRELLKEFTARWQRMRALEAVRRVLEVDVLTAELNVLNEGQRITQVEQDILRQKMDLLKGIGFPVGMTEIEVAGDLEALQVDLDAAVRIALERSTRIAQRRAAVFEQDRVVRQVIYDYLPGVRSRMGNNDGRIAGGEMTSNGGRTYSMAPGAEYLIQDPAGQGFRTSSDYIGSSGQGLYMDLVLELPVSSGLERSGTFQRERALLEQARHLLCNESAETELGVRKAYQTVREVEMTTSILAKKVLIAKKRLQVNERLKELGQATDDQLETFRQQFFEEQDGYFNGQIGLVQAQEALRAAMRYFEPVSEPESGPADEPDGPPAPVPGPVTVNVMTEDVVE